MNIFEQYGIKEVADVTLYAIEFDENDEEIYIPILYLDTLKVSLIEEESEQTSAQGGIGNSKLITWDYGKEINITLEDALYTPASMSLLWGGQYNSNCVELWGVLDSGDKKFSLAKAILKEFSDFSIRADSLKGNVYTWKVNMIVMSLDGKYRYEKRDVTIIYYSLYGRNYWSFEEPVDFEAGNFTLSEGKNLFINIPQDLIYQIKSGIEGVKFLERMEKCIATQDFVIDADINTKHGNYRYLKKYDSVSLTVFINPNTMKPYESNLDYFIRKDGSRYPKTGTKNLCLIKQGEVYYKWTRTVAPPHMSLGGRIVINAQHFPGVYRLVGETYSRRRDTFEDERFQFEIPLCKLTTKNNLTLEAAGEPTVFNLYLQVLRQEDGTMMKLTQYEVQQTTYKEQISGSTDIIPFDDPDVNFEDIKIEATWLSPYELQWGIDEYGDIVDIASLEITHPCNNTEYNVEEEIFWITTEDLNNGDIKNGTVLIEGIRGTIRTELLVQTVDGITQWENETPVFIYDEDGQIQTRRFTLDEEQVQFTSDNELGKEIEVVLEPFEEEGIE